MTIGPYFRFIALVCWLVSSCVYLRAQSTTLTGTVVSETGEPAARAVVTLLCDPEAASKRRETVTSQNGRYIFTGVLRLHCSVQATAFSSFSKAEVDLSVSLDKQEVDAPVLVLPRNTGPAADSNVTAPAPPTFEASGIRGLIDPGGYSAPANAAAASSMLQGMADVRREDSTSNVATIVKSCTVEHALLLQDQAQPESIETSRSLGEFYLARGQGALAERYFRSALQRAPLQVDLVLDLTRAQIAQEQFAGAVESLEALQAPIPLTADLLWAQAEEGLGKFVAASAHYRAAQQLSPNVETIFGQGYELILAGQPEAAGQVFASGLEHYPHSSRLILGRGITEFLSGTSTKALRSFLEAVALNPTEAPGYAFLVQAYLISGEERDRVLAEIAAHLGRFPNDATANYLQALVISHHDATSSPAVEKEAEARLKKAVSLDPALVPAHVRLGILLSRRGDNEAAAQEFKYALHYEPRLAEAHFRLSATARKLGLVQEANREMELFRNLQTTGDPIDQPTLDLRRFVSVFHDDESMAKTPRCP